MPGLAEDPPVDGSGTVAARSYYSSSTCSGSGVRRATAGAYLGARAAKFQRSYPLLKSAFEKRPTIVSPMRFALFYVLGCRITACRAENL